MTLQGSLCLLRPFCELSSGKAWAEGAGLTAPGKGRYSPPGSEGGGGLDGGEGGGRLLLAPRLPQAWEASCGLESPFHVRLCRQVTLLQGSQCDPGTKIASLVTSVCSAPWPEQTAPHTCTLLTRCRHTATCLQVRMTVCVPRIEGRAILFFSPLFP